VIKAQVTIANSGEPYPEPIKINDPIEYSLSTYFFTVDLNFFNLPGKILLVQIKEVNDEL
jgi:hypothetical protein